MMEYINLRMPKDIYKDTIDRAGKCATIVESMFLRMMTDDSPLTPNEREKVDKLFVDMEILTKNILYTLDKDYRGD